MLRRLDKIEVRVVMADLRDPLRGLQMHFVSNAVSNVKKLVRSMAILSEQKMLLYGEIWTSESAGEQELWA
jgi:hypothetical protein